MVRVDSRSPPLLPLRLTAMAKVNKKSGIKLDFKLINRVLREYAKQDKKTGRKL